MHSSEAFIACDDPLEAAVFSTLVETNETSREDLEHLIQGKNIIESYWCAQENSIVNLSEGTIPDLVLTPCPKGNVLSGETGNAPLYPEILETRQATGVLANRIILS